MSKNYFTYQLVCKNCKQGFIITFDNKTAPPSEYAMAIEQKLNEPCPDCDKIKLGLAK